MTRAGTSRSSVEKVLRTGEKSREVERVQKGCCLHRKVELDTGDEVLSISSSHE